MANGEVMQDDAFTAASWDYLLGTPLRVCAASRRRHEPSRCIVVKTTDRGPAKRLYRQGRILDLSPAAFQALAPLQEGVIPVTIEALP